MSKIYVRIQPKQKNTSRFRAGRKFGKAWTELDGIDAATLASLKADQMLQVSDTLPADFAAEKVPGGDDNPTDKAVPTDPAVRLDAIKNAIKAMDAFEPSLFTADGKPKTSEIEKLTGWPVTAAERDAALVKEDK